MTPVPSSRRRRARQRAAWRDASRAKSNPVPSTASSNTRTLPILRTVQTICFKDIVHLKKIGASIEAPFTQDLERIETRRSYDSLETVNIDRSYLVQRCRLRV